MKATVNPCDCIFYIIVETNNTITFLTGEICAELNIPLRQFLIHTKVHHGHDNKTPIKNGRTHHVPFTAHHSTFPTQQNAQSFVDNFLTPYMIMKKLAES